MSDIERCYECNEATGNAGCDEDSNCFNSNPYCDDCFAEIPINQHSEIVKLKAELKRLQGNSVNDVMSEGYNPKPFTFEHESELCTTTTKE